ncbi:MAG: SHOCT domain-containing protein [Actinomycetota bacterium]|nr:SHOCT domain-containing protein [Actinomycetota bacterium]
MNWDGSTAWWIFMPLVMLAAWALVIWAAVTLLQRRPGGPRPGRDDLPGPEAVLADRFARGEIDDREYHQRLDTLRGHQERSPR